MPENVEWMIGTLAILGVSVFVLVRWLFFPKYGRTPRR